MRSLVAALVVVGVAGVTPARSCGPNGAMNDIGGRPGADGFNIDPRLYDPPGTLPHGYITPNPDGGIVITLDGGGTFTCYIAPCQGKVYACGDCIDNDGDGLVDSMDPDCLGACQNNEAGFYGSIPGQNNAPCKSDCYW